MVTVQMMKKIVMKRGKMSKIDYFHIFNIISKSVSFSTTRGNISKLLNTKFQTFLAIGLIFDT